VAPVATLCRFSLKVKFFFVPLQRDALRLRILTGKQQTPQSISRQIISWSAYLHTGILLPNLSVLIRR